MTREEAIKLIDDGIEKASVLLASPKTPEDRERAAFNRGVAYGIELTALALWREVAGTLACRGANAEVALKAADEIRRGYLERFGEGGSEVKKP